MKLPPGGQDARHADPFSASVQHPVTQDRRLTEPSDPPEMHAVCWSSAQFGDVQDAIARVERDLEAFFAIGLTSVAAGSDRSSIFVLRSGIGAMGRRVATKPFRGFV